MENNDKIYKVLNRIANILDTFFLKKNETPIDTANYDAFKWVSRDGSSFFSPIQKIDKVSLNDLDNIESQKKIIDQNTNQFVIGKPANNILLTGAKGTGKSTLVKAVFNKYRSKELKLVEISKSGLRDLHFILDSITNEKEKFIIFCDDLSFDSANDDFKSLKTELDGSITSFTNYIIYATSNRRHLLPERSEDNTTTINHNNEIHMSESIDEVISLSERFGIWITFYSFSQEQYLNVARNWVKKYGVSISNFDDLKKEALQWALQRGSRSGRVAHQFAKDYVGRKLTKNES